MMGAIQTAHDRHLEAGGAASRPTSWFPAMIFPLVQKDGRPEYPEAREATITAWFDDDQETMKSFHLTVA
jgi:hypothetical protein